MAQIPDSVIEEVLSKADIESVVGRYVSFTKRTGSNLFGLCPFHSEKTPSFSVAVDKGIYHCFGCNKGGNSIRFIMEMEKLSYPEAIRYLGSNYGVVVPEDDGDYRSDNTKNLKKRVYSLLTEAARYYYSSFIDKSGKVARDYAFKRELTTTTLKSFGIGYAPEGWDNLYRYLLSKGYNDNEMKVSGLFTVSKKTGKLIDLFRGRLIFPIFDPMGKIIAFGGRSLGNEMPKYVNSPDSIVYKKQEHLYAMNFAKKSNTDQIIVVEGYMDVIAMHQAGITNAVASLGTAFTDSQLRLITRCSKKEVVFFFDSDNAGQSAAIRAIEKMQKYLKRMTGINANIRIKIAVVPDGKDPDEYIKKNGAENFAIVVKNAKDVDDYLFFRAYNDNCDSAGVLDLYKFQDDIIKYASWIHDDLKREKLSSQAALYLNANPKTILKRIDDYREMALKSQSTNEMREFKRQEQIDINARNEEYRNSDDISDSDTSDEDISVKTAEVNKYAELVYMQELNMFIYAVRLKEHLATDIDREDVLRPSDFVGDNMKKIVEFFLKNFDSNSGVSEALLINELSKYVLNGKRAEEVYLSASELIPKYQTTKILVDQYLSLVYGIRLKQLDRIEQALANKMTRMNSNEREDIIKRLRKINNYRSHIQAKGAKL